MPSSLRKWVLNCTPDPNPVLLKEICVIADLNLHTSRGAVQSCGRSMGLVVVGERSLWLSLSRLSEKGKVEFLDAPINPKDLFGATVTVMRQQCNLQKREGEAFKVYLPRKPMSRPYHPKPAKFQTFGESRLV